MQRVIVTGSTGLIGKEVSNFLEQTGYKVIRCSKSLGYDLSFPNSKNIFDRMLLLPLNMTISDEEIHYVSEIIRKYYLNN